MKNPFTIALLYLASLTVFCYGLHSSLLKSTKIDCEQFNKSLACKQLEKENLINKLLN